MKVILIVLSVLAFLLLSVILLFLFLTVKLFARYDSENGALSASVKVLFFTFPLYPVPKKKKTKIKKESLREKKSSEQKKRRKKKTNPVSLLQKELSGVAKAAHIGGAITSHARRKNEREPENEFWKKVKNIVGSLRILTVKAKGFLPKFFDALTLTVESLRIKVGSADAADTAIGYGMICSALETLYALQNETDRFHMREDITVDTDFLSSETSLKLSLRLDVRICKVLYALYLAEDAYYEYKYR